MIINRGPIVNIDNHQYILDYSACTYPVGVVEEQIYYFNEENIDDLIFGAILIKIRRGFKNFLKK